MTSISVEVERGTKKRDKQPWSKDCMKLKEAYLRIRSQNQKQKTTKANQRENHSKLKNELEQITQEAKQTMTSL